MNAVRLRVAGLTILLRSRELSLGATGELYREFLVDGDEPGDLVVDVEAVSSDDGERAGPGVKAWLPLLEGHFYRIQPPGRGRSVTARAWVQPYAGYLSSPGFVECLQGHDPVHGPWRSVGISQSGAYAIDAKAQRARVFLNIGEASDPALLYSAYLLVLLRRLLPQHEGVLLHAAGLANGEGGYVFVGPSGSGKSTVARAARDMGWSVLADDGLIIRREPDGGFRAYRTPWNMAAAPWNGTFGRRPDSVNVRAVHFLRHGQRDRWLPVSPVVGALEMAKNVLPTMQASPGQDAALLFGLLAELAGCVPCFDLCFTPSCRFLAKGSFTSQKGED